MHTLIDCHCHLDFDAFDSERSEVLSRASRNGVTQIIVPGVKRVHWGRIRELCDTRAELHACYGLHPYYADDHSDQDLSQLQHWVDSPDCIAIGECGLDYRKDQADRQVQMKFFDAQLDIARNCNKPVVIHSVRATADVIVSIRNHPGLSGMIHSYSGSYEQAMQLVGMGFFISLGGAITYDHARKIRAAASNVPLDAILLETDAPDQADSAHAGQRNEPAYLVNVLKCLSELREESAEIIAEQTTANAYRLFGI